MRTILTSVLCMLLLAAGCKRNQNTGNASPAIGTTGNSSVPQGADVSALIREFKQCAQERDAVGCGDMKSVEIYNKLSDRMYEIVKTVASMGKQSILQFSVVLNEKPAALSASFLLLDQETSVLSPEIIDKCFTVIRKGIQEEKAAKREASAMGMEMRLRQLEGKFHRF